MTTARVVVLGALLLAVVFAVGLVVGLGRLDTAPTYRAAAVVTIDQPLAIATVPNPGVLDKLARLRFKYAGLLRTDELRAPIAEAADVDTGVVAGALEVAVAPDSLLMTLAATAPDEERAVALATAAAAELIDYVDEEQDAVGIEADDRFEFRVVTSPSGAVDVTDRTRRLLPVLASGIGLVAALAAAALGRRRS